MGEKGNGAKGRGGGVRGEEMEMEVYGEKNKGEGMSCSQCKPILLHTC